ncbi:MAG: 4Fe-4S dicluster domain-containing protein [Deltaproteobacteria bacterium]|nr:4Fe-4S dicluster domain-containing protein [Deltaproteobacteria bacterium]
MKGYLHVDLDKCTGCRTCEIVCSLVHTGENNPMRARIYVIRNKFGVEMRPVYCRQCARPPCAENCPTDAIHYDEERAMVLIDYDKCIGCKICVQSCPFGAMKVDPVTGQVIKCDLCGGDPQCVKYCIDHAITFIPIGKQEKVIRSAVSKL